MSDLHSDRGGEMHFLKIFGLLMLAVSVLLFVRAPFAIFILRRRLRLGCTEGLPEVRETVETLREILSATSGFSGVEALFGCGHRQRIQILERGTGIILRSVPWTHAHERNCHACWFRTGQDLATSAEDA